MLLKLLRSFFDFLMNYVSQGALRALPSFGATVRSTLKRPTIVLPTARTSLQTKSMSWLNFSNLLPSALRPAPQFQPQLFDYFLVLDFEATCDSPKQIHPMEIIEFPVLKVNGQTFEVEDTFHRYVRPTVNPVLSPFCTELTGIIQDMVDEANKFNRVYADFQKWLQETQLIDEQQKPISKFTFVTCGDWDLRKIFPVQCHLCGHEVPKYMRQWINVKKSFTDQVHHWPKSQAYLIEYFGFQPTGRAHSGIDDCHNLVQIFREIAKLGHVYQNTSKYKEDS